MSGDVGNTFREEELEQLYKNADGELDEIGEVCAKWHWSVVRFFEDVEKAEPFVMIIQMAFKKKINLDKNDSWKMLMRMELPGEFIKKMGHFTQVPQIAVMDMSKRKKEEEITDWDELW
jgi:formylmethanofuran dehydrogenase subunit A